MNEFGKFLVIIGLIVAAVGGLLWMGSGKGWFGRLPGDISYHGRHGAFYFPIVTCIVLSVVLTLIFWLVNVLRR